jgi:hypothetical protein
MKILNRLLFSERRSDVLTPDGIAEVKPFQIVVLVTLVMKDVLELDPGAPRFPAVLDTGNNHNFAIREEHLRRWARLSLPEQRHSITVDGQRVPLLNARVWLHPNKPTTLSVADRPAFRPEMPEGIAVYPRGVPNPARLPILGLRGIVRNDLKLVIDGKRRSVSLGTAGWF